MKKSIISNEHECFICGNPNVALHHIYFGTANRQKSDDWGCVVFLCPKHHDQCHKENGSGIDLYLKKLCQIIWKQHYKKTTHEFVQIFGRNYED